MDRLLALALILLYVGTRILIAALLAGAAGAGLAIVVSSDPVMAFRLSFGVTAIALGIFALGWLTHTILEE